jgi:hypothetical protein
MSVNKSKMVLLTTIAEHHNLPGVLNNEHQRVSTVNSKQDGWQLDGTGSARNSLPINSAAGVDSGHYHP